MAGSHRLSALDRLQRDITASDKAERSYREHVHRCSRCRVDVQGVGDAFCPTRNRLKNRWERLRAKL